MPAKHMTLTCDSPEATHRAARALARHLRPGDSVLLSGELGSGKSHFARGAILALLAAPEDVPSPTYTLVQTYHGRNAEIWHADLYRLTDSAEIGELGLDAAFESTICLVEWPDRLGALAPNDALRIGFSAPGPEDTRLLALSWQDRKWPDKLAGLRHG